MIHAPKYILLMFLLVQSVITIGQAPYSLDNSFSCQYPWGYLSDMVTNVDEHSSGKVFIGGDFEAYWGIEGIPSGTILLDSDGSLNADFLTNCSYPFSSMNWYKRIFELKGDTLYDFVGMLCLIDITGNNGWQAYNLNIGNFFDRYDPRQAILEDDGSVIVSGEFKYNNTSTVYDLIRLLPDGNADTSFILDVYDAIWQINDMHKYGEDQLIISGRWNNWLGEPILNGNFNRINLEDASIDNSFKDIFTLPSTIITHEVLPDGKIMVHGRMILHATHDTIGIARLHANGTLDSTFNNLNNIGFDYSGDYVASLCSTPDGGYLIGGRFSSYEGRIRNSIAKIDANGFLDTTAFKGQGIGLSSSAASSYFSVRDIEATLDGKYYIGGSFDLYYGEPVQSIIRIHGAQLGIQEFSDPSEVSVYPNPSTGEFWLNLPVGNYEIRIYSGQGSLMDVYPNHNSLNKIDVSSYENGLYIVQAQSGNFKYATKLSVLTGLK